MSSLENIRKIPGIPIESKTTFPSKHRSYTYNHVEKRKWLKMWRRRMENPKVSFSLQCSRNVKEEKVGYPDGWFESYAQYFFRNLWINIWQLFDQCLKLWRSVFKTLAINIWNFLKCVWTRIELPYQHFQCIIQWGPHTN